MEKKSDVNRIFLFLLSIMVVVFAGFLVIKFISSFTNTQSSATDITFIKDLNSVYNDVYKNYGGEQLFSNRVSSKIKVICFIPENRNESKDNEAIKLLNESVKRFSENNFKTLLTTDSNIFIYSKNDLISDERIGKFYTKNEKTLCIEPKNRMIDIYIENLKNKVYLQKKEE